MTTPKPRVRGETDTTEIRTFGGGLVRSDVVTIWRAWCECHWRGEYPLVSTFVWDYALEVALEHGRLYHS